MLPGCPTPTAHCTCPPPTQTWLICRWAPGEGRAWRGAEEGRWCTDPRRWQRWLCRGGRGTLLSVATLQASTACSCGSVLQSLLLSPCDLPALRSAALGGDRKERLGQLGAGRRQSHVSLCARPWEARTAVRGRWGLRPVPSQPGIEWISGTAPAAGSREPSAFLCFPGTTAQGAAGICSHPTSMAL